MFRTCETHFIFGEKCAHFNALYFRHNRAEQLWYNYHYKAINYKQPSVLDLMNGLLLLRVGAEACRRNGRTTLPEISCYNFISRRQASVETISGQYRVIVKRASMGNWESIGEVYVITSLTTLRTVADKILLQRN